MSGFDENPFGEPTIDNPFAVSFPVPRLVLGIYKYKYQTL